MFESIKEYIPENFFVWQAYYFRLSGLGPPEDKLKKILYLFVSIPHIFSCTVLITTLELIKLFRDFNKDFQMSMMTLALCVFHLAIINRAVFWFFSRSKLEKMKEVIQRNTFEFDCFSIVNLKYEHVFEKARTVQGRGGTLEYEDLKTAWTNAEIIVNHEKNMVEVFRKEKMTQTRLLCCCVYIGINITTFFVLTLSFLTGLQVENYEDFNIKKNTTSTFREYAYPMYFPFDTSMSHGYYWQGYFYQVYAYFGMMLIFLPVDTINVNCIIHVISQTKVVAEAFNNVGENIDYTQDKETVLLIQEIRIVKCINELQELYRAANLLEELNNVPLLIQYGGGIFIICCLTYIIPLVDTIEDFISRVVFLSAVLGEIFIFTYCSQTLTLELQQVMSSVYSLDWSCYPPRLTRNLSFLISRLQSPSILTAGKIFNLDLLFFTQLIQMSYSFYTLISNTNTE